MSNYDFYHPSLECKSAMLSVSHKTSHQFSRKLPFKESLHVFIREVKAANFRRNGFCNQCQSLSCSDRSQRMLEIFLANNRTVIMGVLFAPSRTQWVALCLGTERITQALLCIEAQRPKLPGIVSHWLNRTTNGINVLHLINRHKSLITHKWVTIDILAATVRLSILTHWSQEGTATFCLHS